MILRRWLIIGAVTGLFGVLFQAVGAPSALAATGTTTTTVTVRSGPGDSNAFLGTIAPNTSVSFHCFVAGERSTGRYGTEDIWDALDSGGYIPDALVYTGSNGAVVPACPSDQFGVGDYPVAWTGGGGVQPQAGTSTTTDAVGAVLPDGQLVTVTCETSGQMLTDSKGFVSSLWDQLSNGAYIPNVYIDTQVNGPTPGISPCAQPQPPPQPSDSGSGSSSGQGSGSSGGAPSPSSSQALSYPSTPGVSSPSASAVPQTTKPAGDIPFPKYSYATCPSPQADDGTCLLPVQPAPSEVTRLRYSGDLAEMRALVNFCLATIFPNCARAGYHYLDASGTPVTISVAALYSGLPGFQGQFQYWLTQNVGEAIQSLRGTPANGSSIYKWDTAGTTQNWFTFNAASYTNDWHWTLGHFSVRMVGDVWIGPANQSGDRPVQIRYRSFMWDIYNFGGDFANLEELAKHGMAADFLETGESSTVIVNTTLNSLNPNSLAAHA